MIKKAALIVFTFAALVGAHLAYVQGFAIIEQRLAARPDVDATPFPEYESETLIQSKKLALENFGPNHYTQNVKLTYYDKAKGSYMYAQDYILSEQGTVMTITPYAMISVSRDGLNHKTVTSDKAIIRFNKPYGFATKSAEPQRVVFAELIGNVRIRDDKGTGANTSDDLLIGPMTRVQYDEKTMQITTASDVVIQDQDMRIVGTEMMIQLRRKAPVVAGTAPAPSSGGSSSGFEAETAFLYKNVHIVIANVGTGGILPGQSKPNAQGQTPLDLQCAGQMRIDMPKPVREAPVGPPNPYRDPEPTYARFEKRVRVIRGTTTPDQLNSDMLYLTLAPDKKTLTATEVDAVPSSQPAPAVATATAPVTGSPMTALKLRTAFAQGKEVWVQSESQGMTALCAELKYDKKLEDGLPDRTYLNGGSKRKLKVEKVERYTEGPKLGSIKSIRTLVAIDAEILDYGQGGVNRIIATGSGTSDERPSRNDSITQQVWFEDQMILLTSRDARPGATDGKAGEVVPVNPLRRVITLIGPSKLVDYTSGSTLDAKEKIVAEFMSGPKAPGVTGDGPSRIKWLEAYDNVHLTTPNRTLTAWRKLDARFVDPEPVVVLPPAPGSPSAALVASNGAPGGPQGELEVPLPESKPDAPPPATEGAVDGRASYVLATIIQGQGSTKGELKDAKLRGGVMVHQDPAPGEKYGKNASGEALDLFNQGKGMIKFAVSADEPQATNPDAKTKLASGASTKSEAARLRLASKERATTPRAPARVEFDGKIIESENIIWFDQQRNFAQAPGHGSLVQFADAGLLDDKGLASDKPKGKAVGAREALKITWNEEMRFFGKSRDKQDREVAKAEFRGKSEEVMTYNGKREFRRGVVARMTDAGIDCDVMDVYMDRVIDFSKANKSGNSLGGSAEPNPPTPTPAANEPTAEIALLECWGDDRTEDDVAGVDITSRKYFENTKILKDKFRIRHTHVIYDKRTGDFEGSGPGTVYLYSGELPKATNRPTTRTTSAPAAPPTSPLNTMKLTKIQFTELMKGRIGMAREGTKPEPRIGEFVGNVQTANAVVQSGNSKIDFDKLDEKPDAVFLTSDVLRVRSEPPPLNSKAPDHQLLFASGNAAGRTIDRLIQGDRITYDSATEVMYAYGDDGKSVYLVEQKSPGQMPTKTYGKAAMYNKRTKQFQFVEPQSIQLFDLRTGVRPTPRYPDVGGSPAKPEIAKQKRPTLSRPGKTSAERNGFTGH